MPSEVGKAARLMRCLVVFGLAIGLTYVFWSPLWHGGGLIGGDTYTYFLPQKTYLADQLSTGAIPLWNPLVGHGYPIVAESQTGVLYPTNLLLYYWLEVNTAYSMSMLLHFIAAFVATWLFARRLGLGFAASLLAALVFVYSWFPPRICLEWAIIGAVYFPLTLWCVESFLQTTRHRYLILLSVAIGLHLLAGHFNLVFIEVLTCLAYAILRCNWKSVDSSEAHPPGTRAFVAVALAAAAGFSLAAVQLVPTWELKQLSQRADVGATHDPGYGHIPPWYLSQVVVPWMWYAPEVDADQALRTIKTLSFPSQTNKVEAHLYFGLLPLALAVCGLVYRFRCRLGTPWVFRIWIGLGLAAVVYATGWLLPVTRHLPGFSFFMGPGRYGIVTTMAVALLSSSTLDQWLRNRTGAIAWLAVIAVLGITTADLWTVRIHWNHSATGAPAWYADLVDQPPVQARNDSTIRQILSEYPTPVRMLGTFQNAPTLTGFAMTPPYLGLGPAEYYDPALTIPRATSSPATAEDTAARIEWLQQAGVTHLLTEQPLSSEWPVELAWRGFDPLLNPAAARRDPYFLYELHGSRGRFATTDPDRDELRVIEFGPERTVLELDCAETTTLVQTDILYPGWQVAIDGIESEPVRVDGMFRGVQIPPGQHTVVWAYSSGALRWGALASLVSGLAILLWAITAWRRRARIPS